MVENPFASQANMCHYAIILLTVTDQTLFITGVVLFFNYNPITRCIFSFFEIDLLMSLPSF